MRFTALCLIALSSVALGVVMPQQAVIVSYPDETPDSIVDQAMDAIREAGGMITHEYKIIKGFAANAPAKVLETVQTWGNDYKVAVEVDQIVSVDPK